MNDDENEQIKCATCGEPIIDGEFDFCSACERLRYPLPGDKKPAPQ